MITIQDIFIVFIWAFLSGNYHLYDWITPLRVYAHYYMSKLKDLLWK